MTALTGTSATHTTHSFPWLRRSALAIVVWIGAAATVTSATTAFARVSPESMLAAKTLAIIVFAYAYMRATPDCTIDHALFVGVAWLALAIAAEFIVAVKTGHRWFALLGAPAQPVSRDVLLFVWVAAPALFARRQVIE